MAVTAIATDNNGQPVDVSLPRIINVVKAITPRPTSVISSPAHNSAIAIPTDASTNISIAVDANSSTGSIKKVELYIDGVLFGTKTTYPYTFDWHPTVIGVYNLVALTHDDKDNVIASTTSASATLTPAPTRITIASPPTVTLISPIAGSSVSSTTPTQLKADATDSNTGGTITSVQFLQDGALIAEVLTPDAGTNTFTTTATLTAKTDSTGSPLPSAITARATNSSGISKTSAPVSVSVVAGGGGGQPENPPTVSVAVTAPIAGSTLAVNAPVTLLANATDSNGNIVSVEFSVAGNPVGTDITYPYSATWTPASVGTYLITARAVDNQGNAVTSSAVTVSVGDPGGNAPTVSISAPTTGAAFTVGTPTTVTAVASDDVAIASVQFYLNGQLFGSAVTTFPYSVTWTPTTTGNFTFLAIAKDSSGNQTSSSAVTVTVGGGNSPVVTMTSPSNGASVPLGSGLQINTTATDSDGTITKVSIYANGILIPNGTLTSAPYNVNWVPGAAGTYALTATATDNTGNTTTTSPVSVSVTASSAPVVTITSPGSGVNYGVGTPVPFNASVTAAAGAAITQVQFYVNGISIGTDTQAPYSITWSPGATGSYILVATATNTANITATSTPVTVTVGTNSAPTVVLTSPSAGSTVVAGNAVNLAATASDSDGTIASVRFLANGFVVGTASGSPFLVSWTPTAAGSYRIVAQATDSTSNVATSAEVILTVTGNAAPTVSITSPRTGATVTVATGTTIAATAADSDGTISNVQFYANGLSLGTDSVAPYSISWTPSAEGTYRLTAVAVDNSGAPVTSSTVLVLAAVAGSNNIDTVATGLYIDTKTFSSGEFTIVNLHNRTTTFVAYVPSSSTFPAKTYYFDNIPTDGSGNFELTNSAGAVLISGKFTASGVSGSFADGANTINFTGVNTVSAGTTSSVGYYNGSVTNHLGSLVNGVVGLDGKITIYAADGTLVDAGSSTIDSTGGFSFRTRAGNRFVGTADPLTGLFAGTLTKAGATSGDTFTGAQATGNTFSDGSLRNISSRVLVGTGDRILIAGFVVGGKSPKSVLIRALGPTLSTFGIAGALSDPALFLFNQGGLQIASNDNWATGGAAVSNAASQVGAYALSPSSLDSSLVITLQPGVYSAQVSGVGGKTGVSLLEIYDVDSVAAYASEKMTNISTRGQVGTGENIMIAGFVVNGSAPKKVLVRGVGPTLAAAGVTGALADPLLKIVRQNGTLVRENDNWSVGNEVNLVSDAASKIGAFPLTAGSKDAVILMNLMPGVYSAQLSGADGGSGVGLIEVYEVQ